MKLLLFGGSYNPVHVGHLIMAQEVRRQFGYDLVALVPSLNPPHKPLASDPGPERRLAMLRIAIDGDPTFVADDCEIRRGGASYTIDTIRDLASRYPVLGKIGLLLGDDLVPGFGAWREPGRLAAEADIVCARRLHAERLDLPYPHRYADNPIVDVSSSMIRSRIAAGEGFRQFLPRAVCDYIVAEGLYGLR
ncbi:MAG: nicotinate (nicotinamide) nucleotide adenylyltransferase [Spirochaetaceae bacterium]|nr:nicotinate (nicotinamide) nucleotide adenylyltransferase [Spirochaetaceae bacterium]